jgi:hypothetical protein
MLLIEIPFCCDRDVRKMLYELQSAKVQNEVEYLLVFTVRKRK